MRSRLRLTEQPLRNATLGHYVADGARWNSTPGSGRRKTVRYRKIPGRRPFHSTRYRWSDERGSSSITGHDVQNRRSRPPGGPLLGATGTFRAYVPQPHLPGIPGMSRAPEQGKNQSVTRRPRPRRCANCRIPLPRDASPKRRYCSPRCVARAYRARKPRSTSRWSVPDGRRWRARNRKSGSSAPAADGAYTRTADGSEPTLGVVHPPADNATTGSATEPPRRPTNAAGGTVA